jgi:hypothetical protein
MGLPERNGMNAVRLSHPLALTLAVLLPAWATGQPEPTTPPEDPPPHVMRLEGDGAQVIREGTAEPLEPGDPVLFGDRVDTGSAYVQVIWSDGSRIGLDRGTRVEALAPDLLALTMGRVLVSRPASATRPLRVDTPAASVVLAPAGEYRFTIDGVVTTLAVVRGSADVQSGMGATMVEPGQQVALRDGVAPDAPRRFNAAAYDSFVQWATEPSPAPAAGAPLDTFADPQIEAYSDVFNRYGSWETDAQYGAVWYPTVAVDWRPYSVGYWQPYGGQANWLWVGRDPWGWPTHHFGRWGVNPRGRWFWMPGRQWAPAHVHWSVGPGHIGWTPLGHRDRPNWAWNELSRPRGVYPGGTLDPSRTWTVVPSDRFGRRDRMGAWAVDPRTLDNLSAFVTQSAAPPVRYGVPRGGVYGYGTGPVGPAYVPGSRGPYGQPRTGVTTVPPRGPIGPTRVGPAAPGYGGPTPPPEDPYERAQRAATPRGRQRTPSSADGPATAPPPERAPAPRQRTPSRDTPARETPTRAPRESTPPPTAEAAPPPSRSAPPAASSGRASGTSTGRKAVPRP